jgi:hypothetical protein
MLQEFATTKKLRVSILSGQARGPSHVPPALHTPGEPAAARHFSAAPLSISILPPSRVRAAGDAHVGGVGRFYSRPKMKHVG